MGFAVAVFQSTSAFLLVHAPRGCALSGAPTCFPRCSFMSSFQSLVDTYGVARYGEANPALFAAAIFPFLFGLMFGDVGHGLLLLLLACALLFAHAKGFLFNDELLSMLMDARCAGFMV